MRFLFQGDSITDAGRKDYANPEELGTGYPRLLAADLTFRHSDYEVLNTGISGNRVVDLLARWKRDCINLRPDVLTILIGVNDVWHELNNQNGVSAKLFEDIYSILLRETKEALPETRVILMGAYVTPGEATNQKWECFREEVGKRREITRRLAGFYQADYIDLQRMFDRELEKTDSLHWTVDGIHPTNAGHKLIAEEWKHYALG